MSIDLYQIVTDKIVSMLETGTAPWRSPILGKSQAGHPTNIVSKKEYRGINTFLLAFTAHQAGYDSSYWMTYPQAQQMGGSVRKGEKSSMIVYWTMLDGKDKTSGQPCKIPLLRYYNVFNACQCDGITLPDATPVNENPVLPIDAAQAIVDGYDGAPILERIGSQPCYIPSTDTVRMPVAERFRSSEEYYSTLFHEYAHSTGHESRLDRKMTGKAAFGSETYGNEELVAEMCAAFLCGQSGISPAVIDNNAAYVNGWLKAIKADKKLAIGAAGKAQKASDWILGNRAVEG